MIFLVKNQFLISTIYFEWQPMVTFLQIPAIKLLISRIHIMEMNKSSNGLPEPVTDACYIQIS